MKKKGLIAIWVGWCLLQPVLYFFGDLLTDIMALLILAPLFFILLIIQLVKLIKEMPGVSGLRIGKLLSFILLLFLTTAPWIVQNVMERIDWVILYNKRKEIVQQVKKGQLKPNQGWSSSLCKLPFALPVVSDGGNEIQIYRNKSNNALTVEFWTFRGMPDGGSRSFVYSEDVAEISGMDKKVAQQPGKNRKIQDGWYWLTDE
ncbi:hypothetical protein U0035_01885 [Niabella yanshanensis]|uniref:Uncharacterized protein n=1 Tax=Niabella yanshanensis TaxID=577386 RepID=A0ABZ0W8G5_9BACT|nr:hypothetical protein [Niabella yanshanensis]WQD38893.1 hypothetical protein U0035_01885 [Niabella yanshanensis]